MLLLGSLTDGDKELIAQMNQLRSLVESSIEK